MSLTSGCRRGLRLGIDTTINYILNMESVVLMIGEFAATILSVILGFLLAHNMVESSNSKKKAREAKRRFIQSRLRMTLDEYDRYVREIGEDLERREESKKSKDGR